MLDSTGRPTPIRHAVLCTLQSSTRRSPWWRIGDLARAAGVARTSCYTAVAALEAAGCVRRARMTVVSTPSSSKPSPTEDEPVQVVALERDLPTPDLDADL